MVHKTAYDLSTFKCNLKRHYLTELKWAEVIVIITVIPANIYLFKVNNRNTRKHRFGAFTTRKTPNIDTFLPSVPYSLCYQLFAVYTFVTFKLL